MIDWKSIKDELPKIDCKVFVSDGKDINVAFYDKDDVKFYPGLNMDVSYDASTIIWNYDFNIKYWAPITAQLYPKITE